MNGNLQLKTVKFDDKGVDFFTLPDKLAFVAWTSVVVFQQCAGKTLDRSVGEELLSAEFQIVVAQAANASGQKLVEFYWTKM